MRRPVTKKSGTKSSTKSATRATLNTADEVFRAAGRKSAMVPMGSGETVVMEMDTRDRLEFLPFAKANKDDEDLVFAFLLSRCCPALKGIAPLEIRDRISTQALSGAAIKIMELSGMAEEKKRSARTSVSPTG